MKGQNLYGKGQKILSEQGKRNWDDIRWDKDRKGKDRLGKTDKDE